MGETAITNKIIKKFMKLQNFGKEFEMTYDGRDVKIPNGIFEVSNNALGYFIQTTSVKWGKEVKIIDEGKVAEIKKDIEVEEGPKEEVKEEVKKDVEEDNKVVKKGRLASSTK